MLYQEQYRYRDRNIIKRGYSILEIAPFKLSEHLKWGCLPTQPVSLYLERVNVKHTIHAIHTLARGPREHACTGYICPQTHAQTFYLNCIYSWVNFAKPETSFIIYTHMFFGLSYLPHSHHLALSLLPLLPFQSSPSIHCISLFTLQCENIDTHTHTQNPLLPSVIAIYILCRFVFNTMKPPRGFNWPERDDQRLSSPEATVANSTKSTFLERNLPTVPQTQQPVYCYNDIFRNFFHVLKTVIKVASENVTIP